jgi:Double zinc ribbon
MDQDQRDPRDRPEGEQPDDVADEEPSEEAPAPPPEEPASEPEPAATDEPAPAVPESDAAAEPAAEPGTEPAAGESWPTQDAAPSSDEEAPEATDTRPWPTEPPEAGEPEEGTWPTSAPERGDAAAAESTMPPAEVEAETDESAWPAAGAAAGAAAADAPDAGAEPPPGEAEAYPAAAAASVAGAGAAAQTVPDAEAATGESTQCPRCGTENRPGLAFCRNCGQRLVAAGVATTVERPGTPDGTMACPRCGTHNRSGVAFCQNCGANLRGTAEGYVPPAVAAGAAQERAAAETGGAVLGPVVLIIGLIGLITGYLLPFAYGDDSLFDRAFGPGGYGVAFWSAYPSDASLADTLYFGLAAPVPILAALLAILAVAGFFKARPGSLQLPGLVIALAWSVGLIVLFVVVEVIGNWSGDLVDLLRLLTPGGIILFLASLIVLIGTLTRFGRS